MSTLFFKDLEPLQQVLPFANSLIFLFYFYTSVLVCVLSAVLKTYLVIVFFFSLLPYEIWVIVCNEISLFIEFCTDGKPLKKKFRLSRSRFCFLLTKGRKVHVSTQQPVLFVYFFVCCRVAITFGLDEIR